MKKKLKGKRTKQWLGGATDYGNESYSFKSDAILSFVKNNFLTYFNIDLLLPMVIDL